MRHRDQHREAGETVKLQHVLARLAKRTRRCDDRIAVFPGERDVPGTCPGWRVFDNTNGRGARLLACVECNALAPARLRVTDKDVCLIPEASEALRLRICDLLTQRRARANTTHWLVAEYPMAEAVLCGHALGRTPKGRRRHGWSYNLGSVTCDECRRLAQLTPAARLAEAQARSAELRDKFAVRRAEEQAAKAKKVADRAKQIAEARPDAMVALDFIEARDPVISEAGAPVAKQALIDRALRAAIVAHKHEHPRSRGERLWVFRDVFQGSGSQHCRFCEVRLRGEVIVGTDTSIAGSVPEVSDHTTLCALRYLAREYLPPPRADEASASPEESQP